VACPRFGDAGAAADVSAEPLAAAVRPTMGVLEDRASTLATAGPAIPSVINVATAKAATIRRRCLGTFRKVSIETFQQARAGGSLSPHGIRLDPQLSTVTDTQLARQRMYTAHVSPTASTRREDPLTPNAQRATCNAHRSPLPSATEFQP
jgi:hypothetical protein